LLPDLVTSGFSVWDLGGVDVTVVDLSGVTGLVQVVLGSSQHWWGWLGPVVWRFVEWKVF
jgi:hypothetical protein